MFEGGGATEAVVTLDADDGGVSGEVDPVAPSFGFMARFKVFFAERGENLGDGAGGGVVWEFDECFHEASGCVSES